MKKKLCVLLLGLAVICAYSFTDAAAIFAGNGSTSSKVTIDGMTYEIYDADSSGHAKGTAELEKIDAAKSGAVAIPSTITSGTNTYTVTAIDLSQWDDHCTNITSLSIPDTVTDMENSNFRYFTGLSEITIPGSVKKFTGTFYGNGSIKKITFGEGVEEIASNTMIGYCRPLTTIVLPSTLKTISKPATFANASSLTDITLPEGVTLVENSNFWKCTNLQKITLPASMTSIPMSTFDGCTSLSSVTAKSKITTIGSSAFEGCSSLPNADIAKDATTIGDYAFKGCSLIKTVDLTNATTIGYDAFERDNITSVKLGSGLTKIYDCAFEYDDKLTDIGQLPDGLTYIGDYAFYNCPLSEKTVIPDSVTYLGDGAFWCYQAGTSAMKELTIGNGVTNIKDYAFQNNDKLETVTIGSGIEQISASAFKGCTSLKKVTINASSDDVSIPDSTFADGVQVIFTIASIDAKDDKISDSKDAMTLQEAINQAAVDGKPVLIEKNIKLKAPLNVPAGKEVVLQSSGDWTITSVGKSEGTPISGMMTINKDATLTMDGKITMLGSHVAGGTTMITDNGTFNLKNGVIKGMKVTTNSNSVVNVDGGTMNISGGSITGNLIKGVSSDVQYCGTVKVGNKGTVNMTGGQISGNKCQGSNTFISTSGVFVAAGGAFKLSGGQISGNSAYRGSAVMLYSEDPKARATFTMEGGTISGNTSSQYNDGMPSSGAVHVEDYSDFTMNGGTISGNSSTGSYTVGGGVCVSDSGVYSDLTGTAKGCGTSFTMNGGTISGNKATHAGGGIYSFSNSTTLNAGEISGNSAYEGGGVYSEGNKNGYSNMKMPNVIISENSASKLGGGMWFCNTGSITIAEGTSAIFGNTAAEAGDDVVSADKINSRVVTLADRMAGGGGERWTVDGSVIGGSNSPYGTVTKTAARYDAKADETTVSGISTDKGLALKSLSTEGAQKLAASSTKLVIKNNTASYGGGFGANGGAIIGTDSKVWKLNVNKEWTGSGTKPASVTIDLVEDGTVIDKIILNESNGWKGSFDKLPVSLEGKLTVQEESVSGWTGTVGKVSSVSESGEATVTVTNKPYVPKTPPTPTVTTVSKTVSKVWNDNSNKAGLRPDSVHVQLYANGKEYGSAVTLTSETGWTYTWSSLPEKENGTEVSYSTKELTTVKDYTVSYSPDGTIITNTYKPTGGTTTDNPPNNNSGGPNPPGGGGHTNNPPSNSGSHNPFTPKTGDTSDPGLYLLLLLTSGALIFTLEEIRRKERQ